MARLAIIRRIFLLPGRESDGVRWLQETEPLRRQAGQVSQMIIRGQTDPKDIRLVQYWQDRAAYDAWRRSPDRERLSVERGRFMTHEPTRQYDLIED